MVFITALPPHLPRPRIAISVLYDFLDLDMTLLMYIFISENFTIRTIAIIVAAIIATYHMKPASVATTPRPIATIKTCISKSINPGSFLPFLLTFLLTLLLALLVVIFDPGSCLLLLPEYFSLKNALTTKNTTAPE